MKMATTIKSKPKTKKSWFRLNAKPDIEYSTEFDFFLKNQIATVKSNHTVNFQSRLEVKSFDRKGDSNFPSHALTDENIKVFCKEIHNKILQGEFGEGKLVR